MISDDEDIPIEIDFTNTPMINDYDNFSNLLTKKNCVEESVDLYQQLAEKDHYLMLAAEAGKVLLEKNQHLTNHYESLQQDYLRKIEELEEERHHLRRELSDRENTYESRMQDLQVEVNNLVGQLNQVQLSSKSFEKSHRSNYDDLSIQNNSLQTELNEIKTFNRELVQQVQTLSKRIDSRIVESDEKRPNLDYSNSLTQISHVSNATTEGDDIKRLKERIQHLSNQKSFLEDSISEILQEKDALHNNQKRSSSKVLTLEDEISSLKHQIAMCQDDLGKTKRKNAQLKDKLEEYMLIQSTHQLGTSSTNSLFNELEMSLSEADMNFHSMSTPNKRMLQIDNDDSDNDLPSIVITKSSDCTMDKLKLDISTIFSKLRDLHGQLTDGELLQNPFDDPNNDMFTNTEIVTKLVDNIIDIIQEKILTLGCIDSRSDSPCRLELENCDDLSQTDSQLSDREVDILEQQVHDLNQRLNIATSDLENAKRELTSAQTIAKENQEEAQDLLVKSEAQKREIENLKNERELMLSDTSMEEKLKKALEERNEALKRENTMQMKYEQSQCDMNKLNNQLIAAVQQKLELSEQLEQWQFDMASLIDQQLSSKLKKEHDNKRKARKGSTAKFLRNKLFSSSNNNNNSNKENKRSNTPTIK